MSVVVVVTIVVDAVAFGRIARNLTVAAMNAVRMVVAAVNKKFIVVTMNSVVVAKNIFVAKVFVVM